MNVPPVVNLFLYHDVSPACSLALAGHLLRPRPAPEPHTHEVDVSPRAGASSDDEDQLIRLDATGS
jgi:hypothetical protein